jgi:hypothetical protein
MAVTIDTLTPDDERALNLFAADNGEQWPYYFTAGDYIYVLNGTWSTGKREHEFQHVEALLYEDLRKCPVAVEIGVWRHGDVRHLLSWADPDYDGDGYSGSRKYTLVAIYRLPGDVPIRFVYGWGYWTSRGAPRGNRHVTYYPDGTLATYRRRCREYMEAQTSQAVA